MQLGEGFTYGENVATQQRTFRHEKSRFSVPPSFEGRQTTLKLMDIVKNLQALFN